MDNVAQMRVHTPESQIRPLPVSSRHAEVPRGRRLTRKRGRGQPIPVGAIYIGKPSFRANPFAGRQWGHAKAVLLHARWLDFELGTLTLERLGFCASEIVALDRLRLRVLDTMDELVGQDLVCWCPQASPWCHGNHLINMAADHARAQLANHSRAA